MLFESGVGGRMDGKGAEVQSWKIIRRLCWLPCYVPPPPFYSVEIRVISFLNWHLIKQHCYVGGGGEIVTPSLAWFGDQACFQYVFRNQVGLLKKSLNISSKIVDQGEKRVSEKMEWMERGR